MGVQMSKGEAKPSESRFERLSKLGSCDPRALQQKLRNALRQCSLFKLTLSLVGEEVVHLAGGTVVGADGEALVCKLREEKRRRRDG